MRYDYLKDVNHLKEYMYQKDQAKYVVDYIDVRYFETTQDLDEKTQIIINEKLNLMAMKYNNLLH